MAKKKLSKKQRAKLGAMARQMTGVMKAPKKAAAY